MAKWQRVTAAAVTGLLGLGTPRLPAQVITYADLEDKTAPFTVPSSEVYELRVATGNATQSGAISGSGFLIKFGNGTLTLASGSNSFSGYYYAYEGTLRLGTSDAVAPATVSVSGGTVSFGTLTTATFGALAGSGTLRLENEAGAPVSLVFGNTASDTTFSGALTGNGSLTMAPAGMLHLAGNSTFSGPTYLSTGKVMLETERALQNSTVYATSDATTPSGNLMFRYAGNYVVGGLAGSGNVTLYSASSPYNASPGPVTLIAGGNNESTTYSGMLKGSGNLTKVGNGTLTLTGADIGSFSGNLTVAGGTLKIASYLGLYSATLVTSQTGGQVTFDSGLGAAEIGALTGDGNIDAGSAGLRITHGAANKPVTYSGVLSGNASLTHVGLYPLTLAGNNTFTGNTTVGGDFTNPTIILAAEGALQNSTFISGSGQLQFSSLSRVILGGLEGSTPLSLGNATNPVALSIGNNNSSTYHYGIISGNGSITKIGTGTLMLAGGGFSGGVIVAAGTLKAAANTAFGTGTVDIAAGATVDLGRNYFDVARFTGQGVIKNGDLFYVGSSDRNVTIPILGNGSFVMGGTGVLTLSGNNTYNDGTLLGSGTLALGHDSALGTGALRSVGGTLMASGAARAVGNILAVDGDTTLGGSTALTLSGNVALAGNRTLTVSNTAPTTLSGTISGGGNLAKTGNGTLTLSQANTFAGNLTLTGGTLDIAHYLALNNSTLVTSAGVGQVTFSSGPGLVAIGALSGGLNLDVGSAGITLVHGFANKPATYSGVLSGNASLTHVGLYPLTLAGNNTFTGNTTLGGDFTDPTITLAAEGALQNSTFISTYGHLDLGTLSRATLGGLAGNTSLSLGNATHPVALSIGNNNATTLHNGTISGSGSIIKIGTGTLTLSGGSSFTGGVKVEAGTLAAGSFTAFGTGKIDVAVAGTVDLNANAFDLFRFIGQGTLTNGQLDYTAADDWEVTMPIRGTAALVVAGNAALTLSGNSSYSGGTMLASGTLALGHDSALGTGPVSLRGGVLEASGPARAVGNILTLDGNTTLGGSTALTFSGGLILAGNHTLTVANTALTRISGTIGESGGTRTFSKSGAGTLELSGANTFTGGAFLGAGTVRIVNTSGSAFGTGTVTVAAGATLTGPGTFTGALVNHGTYAPGASPAAVNLSGLTQSGTGTLQMELAGLLRGTQYDALNISGTLTFGGTLQVLLIDGFTPSAGQSFDLFNYTTATGTFATLQLPGLNSGLAWNTSALYSDGVLSVAAIPEPATCTALAGVLALGLVRRRRRTTSGKGGRE